MYGKFNIQRNKPDIEFQHSLSNNNKKVMRAGEAEEDEEKEGKNV